MKERVLETFVPLYISNYCDSNCLICNMRKSNGDLVRIEASDEEIFEQLKIIYEIEKISSVCFLCGEYYAKEDRVKHIKKIIKSITCAFEIGFKKVFFNIGALFDDEIGMFYKEFVGSGKVVLSLFQETYDRDTYHSYFGRDIKSIPKAHFDLRYSTPARWLGAGFKSVDIGILLGLHNPYNDRDKLIEHANMLSQKGEGEVYVSLPRIRGVKNVPYEIDDMKYSEIIKRVRIACPDSKLIITTRETREFIDHVLDYIDVVSPGCSDVIPYTVEGELKNNILTSQFVVSEKRERPSKFLDQFKTTFAFYKDNIEGNSIDN